MSLYPVYIGIWTNWSDGSKVLTVGRNDGPLLISAIALFVGLSIAKSETGPHHALQVLLRNSTSSASSLWAFVIVSWPGVTARSAPHHLGINARPNSRLRFRMAITCAPILAEERHSSNRTHTPPRPCFSTDDAYWYYYLGPTSYGNFTLVAFDSAY
ncbi:hypothetical protein B0T26DRAFT_802366 [Lasiosphaeria miniovina]|uniref:Uncharacterized protein n=1 Tax=Lasiosphaeria miniovina TaxID=1954250 RepID=A0AA40DXY8_9PEZI|nr:uncharacterized protein B0T26DRAFT_802366 [Lasiosphaeria miniovina]KAK0717141.1 hypothetical protein B0T26DRAFT_802366 [Lasiosphaeria miniovina]